MTKREQDELIAKLLTKEDRKAMKIEIEDVPEERDRSSERLTTGES